MSKKAKRIALMGINNIGKTTQQLLLESFLKEQKYQVATLKYPLYNLEPTGPRCNAYLRKGNPENLTPKEFQQLCAQNRFDFQDTLEGMSKVYDYIILEMYTGSGICFGMADGVDKQELVEMNDGLLIPDTSILLDGERFLDSKEEIHNYEQDDLKMKTIRDNHLELAHDLGWSTVNANQSIEKVHNDIMNIINN